MTPSCGPLQQGFQVHTPCALTRLHDEECRSRGSKVCESSCALPAGVERRCRGELNHCSRNVTNAEELKRIMRCVEFQIYLSLVDGFVSCEGKEEMQSSSGQVALGASESSEIWTVLNDGAAHAGPNELLLVVCCMKHEDWLGNYLPGTKRAHHGQETPWSCDGCLPESRIHRQCRPARVQWCWSTTWSAAQWQ